MHRQSERQRQSQANWAGCMGRNVVYNAHQHSPAASMDTDIFIGLNERRKQLEKKIRSLEGLEPRQHSRERIFSLHTKQRRTMDAPDPPLPSPGNGDAHHVTASGLLETGGVPGNEAEGTISTTPRGTSPRKVRTGQKTIVSYSDRFIPSRCVFVDVCVAGRVCRDLGPDSRWSLWRCSLSSCRLALGTVWCVPRGRAYWERLISSNDRAGTSRLDTTVLERETVASHVPVKAENKDHESASLYGMMLRSELLGCGGSMPASPEKVQQHMTSNGQQGNDRQHGGTRHGAIDLPNAELHRAAEANMHYGLLESPMTHLGGGGGFGAGGTGRRSGGNNDTSMSMPGTSPRSGVGGGYASISASKSPGSTPRKTLFRYVTDSSDAYGSVCKSAFQQRGIAFGGSNEDSSFSFDSGFSPHGRLPRRINRTPFKVLDAPQLADDFYLNLVDWSSTNILAVGLGSCVYLWSACTSKVTRLVDLGDDMAVCSVSWSQRGHYLSVGVDNGDVQIWDAVKCRKLRTMQGHRQRVGCISWSHHVLATGSRDRNILMRDVRTPSHFYSKLSSHRSEVCGLKWSPDDRELASGGNDNLLMVWQPGQGATSDPVQRFVAHQAAVKAIAWSPHQHGLIASGGGTADRCIKFWNTSTGAALQSVDTGSQVCNLAWSKNVNEIVSTHGTLCRTEHAFPWPAVFVRL